MEMIKKCFHPKVLLVLAFIALGMVVFVPHMLAAALPLLLLAACPLSMIGMMLMMKKSAQPAKDTVTPERKEGSI